MRNFTVVWWLIIIGKFYRSWSLTFIQRIYWKKKKKTVCTASTFDLLVIMDILVGHFSWPLSSFNDLILGSPPPPSAAVVLWWSSIPSAFHFISSLCKKKNAFSLSKTEIRANFYEHQKVQYFLNIFLFNELKEILSKITDTVRCIKLHLFKKTIWYFFK